MFKKQRVIIPSKSNAGNAIHNIIMALPNDPTELKADLYNVESLNDLKIKLNIEYQLGNMSEFVNTFDFEHKSFKTNALLIIRNEYFTVNYDHNPYLGIYNFFENDISLQTIKELIKEDDIPLFISSVQYEFQILVSFQTNREYSDLVAELDVNGAYILNIGALFHKLSQFTDIHFHMNINGIPLKSSDLLEGDINKYIDLIKNNETNLGNPYSYCLYNIADCTTFHFPIQFSEASQNKISILYVVPDSIFKKGIDFSFLSEYRKNSFVIELTKENETDFKNHIRSNQEFLSTYRVIMLGGVDGRFTYSKFDKDIVDKIKIWNQNKGVVLFLHDFIKGNRIDEFRYFIDKLGYSDSVNSSRYTKAMLCINAPQALINTPFSVKPNISLSKTHESANYDPQYMLIKASDANCNDAHYYSENLRERIADCSIGHNSKLTSDEEALFVNIIYHLTVGTKRQQNNDNIPDFKNGSDTKDDGQSKVILMKDIQNKDA